MSDLSDRGRQETFADVAKSVELVDLRVGCVTREVDVGFEPVTAVILDDARPMVARASALISVARALEDFEIDYFAVPGFNDRGSVLAIDIRDRDAVLECVRKCFAHEARIAQLLPRPRIARRGLTTASKKLGTLLKAANALRLTWYFTDVTGSIVLGASYAVEIEFWQRRKWQEGLHGQVGLDAGVLAAMIQGPRSNRAARLIEASAPVVDVDPSVLTRITACNVNGAARRQQREVTVRTRRDCLVGLPDQITFPIDVVYTWVDGSDPVWAASRARYDGSGGHHEAASDARYLNRDELRYSLRSLYANAPWVNHVYIVTDGQTPQWLDLTVPGVTVVDHREIFADVEVLPVFNSHAIESQIHRIPNLAEHFIYFNDDMFIGRPIPPNRFFYPNGLAKYFPSPTRVPLAARNKHDSPVDSATKNNRSLLLDAFGVTISQVMEHAPYALNRLVLEEMEARFGEAFAVTSRARFRSATDHNIPSNLALHYANLSGRSVPSSLSFAYVGIAIRDLTIRLERLLARRDKDAFCLNDTFSQPDELEAQMEIVGTFLEKFFPQRCPWEQV